MQRQLYQLGSVEQVLATLLNPTLTLWAFLGGSPSGNGAGRPWYFKLAWQTDCSVEPWPCGFTIFPENPQEQVNLAIDATSQASAIKSAALAAFKKAFDKYPATVLDVDEGRAGDGHHRVNVIDGFSEAEAL